MSESARAHLWEAGYGGLVVLVGAGLVAGILEMPDTLVQMQVGPKLFPGLVAAVTLAVGGLIVVHAVTGRHSPDVPRLDFLPFAIITAGLLLDLLLIERVGFVLASTLLFVAVARAFASNRPLRDAGVGLAIAALAYGGFTRLLGIDLPAGSWFFGA